MVIKSEEKPATDKNFDWKVIGLSIVIAVIAVIARRPSSVFHAQFWAEDGTFWFANAYNNGISALFVPHTGYFQTISRLGGWIATMLPLRLGPLLFSAIAIIVQVLPVGILLSSRFAELVPDKRLRFLMAILYIVLPNSGEEHANLTNAQWHLALATLLIALSKPSPKLSWRIFDTGMIILGGLSGPFAVPLFVILAVRSWKTRDRWMYILTALDFVVSAIQGVAAILTVHQARSSAAMGPLGASFGSFLKIISGQIYLGLLLGQHMVTRIIIIHRSWQQAWVPAILFVLFTALVIWALIRGPHELKLFIIYAAFIMALALISPVVSANLPQWQLMTVPGVGQRYYFFPMLAFGAVLIWMLSQQRLLKIAGAALLLLAFIIAVPHDWSFSPYSDFGWSTAVKNFEAAPAGTAVKLPINPQGWTMTLIKR